MKKILIMAPGLNGPGHEKKYNSQWPGWLEKAVISGLWRVINPAILVLAALTDRSKYSVDVVDEEFQEVDTMKRYDIAAMYTITPNVKRAYFWAEYFRKRGTWVVLGGVHATVLPQEASLYADTVLIGEGEYIWPGFLSDFEAGTQKKTYFQALGEVNIEHSPVPAFEYIPQNARRIIPIQTARGCPHGCRFCSIKSLYGMAYRPKSLDRVCQEIDNAVTVSRRSTIYFTDDNLFCHKDRARKFADQIKDYGISWYTNSDLSFGQDGVFLKEIYKSGCRQVLIGFESLNTANLKQMDQSNFKMRHVPLYEDTIDRIQSNGIGVVGSFIVGLDEDDEGIFERLKEFIFRTKLYGASITVNTPYPGTELFKEMDQAKRIATYDWDQYTIFQPVIKPGKMDKEKLEENYVNLLQTIYSQEFILNKIQFFKEKFKIKDADSGEG